MKADKLGWDGSDDSAKLSWADHTISGLEHSGKSLIMKKLSFMEENQGFGGGVKAKFNFQDLPLIPHPRLMSRNHTPRPVPKSLC